MFSAACAVRVSVGPAGVSLILAVRVTLWAVRANISGASRAGEKGEKKGRKGHQVPVPWEQRWLGLRAPCDGLGTLS